MQSNKGGPHNLSTSSFDAPEATGFDRTKYMYRDWPTVAVRRSPSATTTRTFSCALEDQDGDSVADGGREGVLLTDRVMEPVTVAEGDHEVDALGRDDGAGGNVGSALAASNGAASIVKDISVAPVCVP